MTHITVEPARPLFTYRTLAAYLTLGERTVRRMVADGKIAAFKVEGGRVRIRPEAVDAYLAGLPTR